MQECSCIGRTFNYTPRFEALNYPRKEDLSVGPNTTVNHQIQPYDNRYPDTPQAQTSASRDPPFRLPSFASLVSSTDPTYFHLYRLPSIDQSAFNEQSVFSDLTYSTIAPSPTIIETNSIRSNKKPRRARKPKYLSNVLHGKWSSGREPLTSDGHQRRSSTASSTNSSSTLTKPRWQETERLHLFKAIVKEKQLDDMASFSWDRISLAVGRAKKACKDQWRREVLPALMERLK